MKTYKHAIIGGTFDRLHNGHRALLQMALEKADRITVALAVPGFAAQKELTQLIQSFDVRQRQLEAFLAPYQNRSAIIPLYDPYGPAAYEKSFDAIVASSGTQKNITHIQELRAQNRLPPLQEIYREPVVDTSGLPLTSTRIRGGVVGPDGFCYESLFNNTKQLPDTVRHLLTFPLGDLLSEAEVFDRLRLHNHFLLITVGDVATQCFKNSTHVPHLSIFDLYSRRIVFADSALELGAPAPQYQVVNPPGYITKSLVGAIQKSLTDLIQNPQKRISIQVEGEEDLAALPAIMLSPVTTVVIYGQPDRGLVYTSVNEAAKKRATALFKKFK